jgi:hypothetical protein
MELLQFYYSAGQTSNCGRQSGDVLREGQTLEVPQRARHSWSPPIAADRSERVCKLHSGLTARNLSDVAAALDKAIFVPPHFRGGARRDRGQPARLIPYFEIIQKTPVFRL